MNKLIKVLIKELNNVKENSNDATLEFSDNKEAIYDDLLIPLMNLTNSDSLTALYNCLNVVLNETQESEEFTNIANLLVKYIMDDTSNENNSDINQEFNDLLLNCVAVFNTIKDAQDNGTIEVIDSELTEYINSNIKRDKDESDFDKENKTNSDSKDIPSNNEDDQEDKVGAILNIVPSSDQVDDEI
jgi:hypothetical protein